MMEWIGRWQGRWWAWPGREGGCERQRMKLWAAAQHQTHKLHCIGAGMAAKLW